MELWLFQKMRLQLHEYNFSPSAAISALNNKINGEDEHLSFIDVNKQDKAYGPYITVTNQENVQWVAATQFCHNVKSTVRGQEGMQYQNCGQFLLLNGYSTDSTNNPPKANNLLFRSDLPPKYLKTTRPHQAEDGEGNQDPIPIIIWFSCHAPISSIQAQYGNLIYPSNAIDTRINKFKTNPQNATIEGVPQNEQRGKELDIELLRSDGLYNEYRKAVGFKNPAVPEDIFKKTMPFFMVRFTPNIKLMQSKDLIIRMPGFSGAGNIGAQNAKVSIIYGQLKSFNISPSGIISESISSF